MKESLFDPSDKPQWTDTQWKKTENTTAKLQHRIAKVTQTKKARQKNLLDFFVFVNFKVCS
jgi:hypothetical protein